MLCLSPPCVHGFAGDVGWPHAARLVAGASCALLLTFAGPAVAHASSPLGPAPAMSAAAACTTAPRTLHDDPLDRTTAHEPDRTPCDSTNLRLDETDDENGRERVRAYSHDSTLAHALGLRRPSHAGKGSLTHDGLLPHRYLVHSVRRL